VSARPLPEGFEPYVWALTAEEVAARWGLHPAQVIRFDANVPPLPGVPQVPLGESFARLNEYPEGTYRDLREAAAGYAGVDAAQVVVGAGADGLIELAARTFLGPGRRAYVSPPTYPLYAIASGVAGAELADSPEQADLVWICNPNNPTGELVEPDVIAALARSLPEATVVVDEAYFECAEPDRAADALEGVRPRRVARRLRRRRTGGGT
jgi:histidinol-phosphate aminotransferase